MPTNHNGTPNAARTDIVPLARTQLRAIQAAARTNSTAATNAALKAHWADVADRAGTILDPRR